MKSLDLSGSSVTRVARQLVASIVKCFNNDVLIRQASCDLQALSSAYLISRYSEMLTDKYYFITSMFLCGKIYTHILRLG